MYMMIDIQQQPMVATSRRSALMTKDWTLITLTIWPDP
jgi:hypothetical protein